MVVLAYAACLAGMALYGVASVLQAYAAARATGAAVLRHPAYLGGLACDGMAWLASLVALVALPVFVVQSVLAGSLAVTVALAALALRSPVTRRDIAGIGVVVVGLVLVALSAGSESANPVRRVVEWGLLVGALVVGLAGAASYPRGGMLTQAVVAGLGYGAVGVVLYARALEHGPVGPPTAALWVVEVLVPGALGVLLLGDSVRHGWWVAAILGVAAAVAGCVVLATSRTSEALASH